MIDTLNHCIFNLDMSRNKHLIIVIVFFVIGLILRFTYRPYIFKNHIFDFHLADTLGNLLAVPAAVHFTLFTHGNKYSYKELILKAVAFFIFYEFVAFWGTFDYYDIVATILSGFVTFFLMNFLSNQVVIKTNNKIGNNK